MFKNPLKNPNWLSIYTFNAKKILITENNQLQHVPK